MVNDCVPYCALGHFSFRPVRVRLWRRKRCGDIERYAYTRLSYRLRGRSSTVSFPCKAFGLYCV
jgi:hypothetical protein